MRPIREDERWARVLVLRLRNVQRSREALLAARRIPGEHIVFGDEDVGPAVTVEVDEAEIGIAHVAIGARDERTEGLPACVVIMLVEARCRAVEHDEIEPPLAFQIHPLRLCRRDARTKPGRDALERRERRLWPRDAILLDPIYRAEIALIEPSVGLLRQDSRQAFALEIDPLVGLAVESFGEILNALRVELAHRRIDRRRRIGKLKRRQRARKMGAVLLAPGGRFGSPIAGTRRASRRAACCLRHPCRPGG